MGYLLFSCVKITQNICIIHKNIPNTLSKISSIISAQGINIENMINKSKGDYAYTMIDCEKDISVEVEKVLSDIEGVIRIRVIK